MHALQFHRQSTFTSSAWRKRPLPSRRSKSPNMTWYWLPLALVLVGWSAITNAAEYAIQVGAFENPNQDYAESLRSYGEVNTAQSSSGVTVFTVGRYSSVDEAKADLNRIAADYPGAFVRNLPSAASASSVASNPTPSRQKAMQPSRKTPDTQLWESLSEAERRRVVYLDGILHLKQGDQFVPLTDYRRSQEQ